MSVLCSRCKKEPRLENHPAYCRTCRNAYSREWRKRNPGRRTPINKEAAKAWSDARRARNRAFVLAAKQRPCADCGGEFHPVAMQFDHVRGEKLFTLSRGSWATHSLAKLQEEIDKCEVVCANCHAVRTWGEDPNDTHLRGI